MEIRRITAQKQSIDDFYAETAALGQDNYVAKVGMRMLDLLKHLRAIDGPSVWGVTSHKNLCLKPGDDYRFKTLFCIECNGDWFHLSYRMPPNKAPWLDAYITGDTRDVERAGEMIVFGLREALQATDLDSRRY